MPTFRFRVSVQTATRGIQDRDYKVSSALELLDCLMRCRCRSIQRIALCPRRTRANRGPHCVCTALDCLGAPDMDYIAASAWRRCGAFAGNPQWDYSA
jgi:hypothetical protein